VWASLSVEPVSERIFRAERITEGKIAVNEDSFDPDFLSLLPAVSRSSWSSPSDTV